MKTFFTANWKQKLGKTMAVAALAVIIWLPGINAAYAVSIYYPGTTCVAETASDWTNGYITHDPNRVTNTHSDERVIQCPIVQDKPGNHATVGIWVDLELLPLDPLIEAVVESQIECTLYAFNASGTITDSHTSSRTYSPSSSNDYLYLSVDANRFHSMRCILGTYENASIFGYALYSY